MERRPIDRVRGTQDLTTRHAVALDTIRTVCERSFAFHGFRRIDTPIIEPAELHLRKSGLEIISKLYAFHDLGGRRICLRPELTAGIVRAAVAAPPARLPDKVFSTGPVFRYERPSRGRFRQFLQTGVEVFGAEGVLADAEVIALAAATLDDLGITGYTITIGNVGILSDLLTRLGLGGRRRALLLECLEETRRQGVEAVRTRLAILDPDAFAPATTNPSDLTGSEILQSTDPPTDHTTTLAQLVAHTSGGDLGRRTLEDVTLRLAARLHGDQSRAAVERALTFIEELSGVRGDPVEAIPMGYDVLARHGLAIDPLADLQKTITLLESFGVDPACIRIDLGLSRGLQYYTGMVFEIDHTPVADRSERQLCGGGRYDDLVSLLGGRPVPATGFAFGIDRLAIALASNGTETPATMTTLLVVPAQASDAIRAVGVATALRRMGIATSLDTSQRTTRGAIAYAAREGYPAVVIVTGDDPATHCRPRALAPQSAVTTATALAPQPKEGVDAIPISHIQTWLADQGIAFRDGYVHASTAPLETSTPRPHTIGQDGAPASDAVANDMRHDVGGRSLKPTSEDDA